MPCEVPLNLAGHVGYFVSIHSAEDPVSIPCLNLKGTETNEKNKTAACDLRSYCADAALSGCAHPWRIASNPNPATPMPDNGTDAPSTDVITSGEPADSAVPTETLTSEPDTAAPTDGITAEPTGDATDEPATDSPSGSPTDKPTEKPTAKPTEKPTPKPTATPKPDIPAFSTKAINNGNTYDNSMFSKAKVTMVNVWATTCGPCIQEMPHIQQLANNYAGRGLKVVTVLGDSETPGCINTALAIIGGIQGFNLPVLRNNSSVAAAFPAGAYPTTYFIDSNGNILKVVTTKNSYDQWCSIIDNLL